MNPTHHLPIDLGKFGFVQREFINGKKVPNQCGRDFFYYCLNYYYPERHNPKVGSPAQITKMGLFGWGGAPIWLISTGVTFWKVPAYFRSLGLQLSINGAKANNYLEFMLSFMLFRSQSYEEGMEEIESAIDKGVAVGIDVSMALFGLLDHIMFVYGYDDENLYVFDTHIAGLGLEYEKLTPEGDNRFIMKLPKSAVKNRWTIFNRVWVLERV